MMSCLRIVRCKICPESFQLSEEAVVVSAELATFTAAHDHEVVDFDMVFKMVDEEMTVTD